VYGLGVVVNPNGSYYVPGYCSWAPFSSFTQACKPPTEAEFLADQMSSVGPAARQVPGLVADLQTTWEGTLESQCVANPQQCAEYKAAIEYPNFSAAFGTGAASAVKSVSDSVKNLAGDMSWWALLGLGAVGLFAATTLLSPRPRRYGR
jgi:hypothetical protein